MVFRRGAAEEYALALQAGRAMHDAAPRQKLRGGFRRLPDKRALEGSLSDAEVTATLVKRSVHVCLLLLALHTVEAAEEPEHVSRLAIYSGREETGTRAG